MIERFRRARRAKITPLNPNTPIDRAVLDRVDLMIATRNNLGAVALKHKDVEALMKAVVTWKAVAEQRKEHLDAWAANRPNQ